MDYTYRKLKVGTVLFNEEKKLLYVDKQGNEIIGELRNYGE